MEENKDHSSILLRALTVLLCLTLVSFWMLGNMYARYTTQASGEDSARVAKFSITDTSDLQKNYAVTLIPGKTERIQIQITNNSEVAVQYTFAFLVEGNLPLNIDLKEKKTEGQADPVNGSGNNTWTIEKEAATNEENDYIAELSLTKDEYQCAGGVAMLTLNIKVQQIH